MDREIEREIGREGKEVERDREGGKEVERERKREIGRGDKREKN